MATYEGTMQALQRDQGEIRPVGPGVVGALLRGVARSPGRSYADAQAMAQMGGVGRGRWPEYDVGSWDRRMVDPMGIPEPVTPAERTAQAVGDLAVPIALGVAPAASAGLSGAMLELITGGAAAGAGQAAIEGGMNPTDAGALEMLMAGVMPGAVLRRTPHGGRALLEESVENLQDVPPLPQKAYQRQWARGPSAQHAEQRAMADAIVRRPENIDRSMQAIKQWEEPGRAWYNLNPLRSFVAETLEDEKAAEDFMRGFAARFTARSPGTRVPKNTQAALYHQAAHQRGIPVSELDVSSDDIAFGRQGHPRYYKGMRPSLERIEAAQLRGGDPFEAFDPNAQQKTVRFGEGLAGNYQNVPGDMWETRRHFGINEGVTDYRKGSDWATTRRPTGGTGDSPSPAEHDAMEDLHREILAPANRMEPAQSMAAEWMQMVNASGGDERIAMQILNDELARLARKTNKSPRKLLTQIVKGTIPRKALGGSLGLGMAYGTIPNYAGEE